MWCAIAIGGGVVRHCGWLRVGVEFKLVAVEPACVLDLIAVDGDIFRQRDGMAPDHQRGRKRPGWSSKYFTRAQAMPTSSSTSRRTASSVDSPGSAKPARHDHMVSGKTRRTAEHATLAGDRQHDDHRIRFARKSSAPAEETWRRGPGLLWTAKPRRNWDRSGGGHASREPPWLGQRRHVFERDHTLHRDGAQIDQPKIGARLRPDRGPDRPARNAAPGQAGRGTQFAHSVAEHGLGDETSISISPCCLSTTSSPPIT